MNKSVAELVIKPQGGFSALRFAELWQYRELLYFLTWRDIKVKYKQSLLGLSWVFFRPVISMLIFSLLFGRVAQIPSEGVPYPLFVFLGLLPWLYFSTSLSMSTISLVASVNLVSKIYFPRLIIPVSANLANLFDFLISLLILGVIMVYYKLAPGTTVLLAPLMILIFFITSLGPGILCGALNVRYRDMGQIIPFAVQLWLFVTPVIYPVSFIPEKYRLLMYLNPMAGPIEAFRAIMLGNVSVNVQGLLISLAVSVSLLAVGLIYFKKVERTFADVI